MLNLSEGRTSGTIERPEAPWVSSRHDCGGDRWHTVIELATAERLAADARTWFVTVPGEAKPSERSHPRGRLVQARSDGEGP